jgi:hypothetical protein
MANEAVGTEAPAGTTTGGEGSKPAATGEKPATGTASPNTSTGTAGAGSTEFKYKEDRSTWVPPHRISEETKKRVEAERKYQEVNVNLESERKRVQALVGLTPQSAEDQQVEQVRAALTAIFPGLARLSDEQFLAKLESVAGRDGEMQAAVEQHWTTHGRAVLDQIEDTVADTLGGDLTDRQKNHLSDAYIKLLTDNPDLRLRHERGDQALIAEFTKNFIDDWYKPAQRQVTGQQVNRLVNRRTPNGRESRPIVQNKPKVDYADDKAFGDALVSSFKEYGGEFGRG